MRGLVVVLLFLLVTLGCATSTQRELDAEVNRLCAIDGGIKVYERVVLPAKKYEKYVAHLPSKERAKPADEYYLELEVHYYRRGKYEEPAMWRSTYRIVRRSDGKVLGELIAYSRRGGDIPGPWHPSSFTCPAIGKDQPQLETSVFQQGDAQ